jgi:hypothetical protein
MSKVKTIKPWDGVDKRSALRPADRIYDLHFTLQRSHDTLTPRVDKLEERSEGLWDLIVRNHQELMGKLNRDVYLKKGWEDRMLRLEQRLEARYTEINTIVAKLVPQQ